MDAVETLKESGRDVVRTWPLLGVRLAEQVAMTMIVVASVFAFLVPLFLSGIFAAVSARTINTPEEAMKFVFADHAYLLVLLFVAILVVITLTMIVHAFVQSGIVGELLALDRRQRALDWREGPKNFSLDRFFRAGRDGTWTAFWIFQIVWSAVALVLLAPLLVTLVMMYSRGLGERSVAVGCGGLVLTLLLAIPLSILAGTWTQASLICARRDALRAPQAAAAGWREITSRFSDTLNLVLLFIIVSVLIMAAAIGMTFAIEAISRYAVVALMLLPLRLAIVMLESLYSLFTSNWFVAAIVRLTNREQSVS